MADKKVKGFKSVDSRPWEERGLCAGYVPNRLSLYLLMLNSGRLKELESCIIKDMEKYRIDRCKQDTNCYNTEVSDGKFLSSVGCYISFKDGWPSANVYAVDGKGHVVWDSGVHISECSDEWFNSLSPEDEEIANSAYVLNTKAKEQ